MPDDEIYDPSDDVEDDGVLDASDTLEGDPGDDPLDTGIVPPDRWSAGERYGTTAEEERAGESLDELLAEEEPDVDPYADDDQLAEPASEWRAGADGAIGTGIAGIDGPEPRAGRLVAEDEGARAAEEPDLVARDVGIDAGAAGAEEAAVHVIDEDSRDG